MSEKDSFPSRCAALLVLAAAAMASGGAGCGARSGVFVDAFGQGGTSAGRAGSPARASGGGGIAGAAQHGSGGAAGTSGTTGPAGSTAWADSSAGSLGTGGTAGSDASDASPNWDGSAGSGGAGAASAEADGFEAGANDATSVEASADDAPPDSSRCALNAVLLCDDADPCTIDRVDQVSCECKHEPLAPDEPCNDGDLCTEHDRCVAGRCVGRPLTSRAEVLGMLQAFGPPDKKQVAVGFPNDHRALFFSSGQVALLDAREDQLELLDRQPSGAYVALNDVYPSREITPGDFVVPLGTQRVALIASGWGIELYDIGQDRLSLLERYGFSSIDKYRGAAGIGNRLWVCNGSVQSFTIDESSNAITTGPSFSSSSGHYCQGLAASPDGKTLYEATTKGLDALEVGPDGTLSLIGSALEGYDLFGVAATSTRVAVFQYNDDDPRAHRVLVLRGDTLAQVAEFSRDARGSSILGMAMVEDGLLVHRSKSSGCDGTVLELHALDTDVPVLRSSQPVSDGCDNSYRNVYMPLVASGHLVSAEAMHQVLRIAPAGAAMTPIRGRLQGSFDQVLAASPTTVEVHGRASMHLVDLSIPDLPVVKEGGLISPLNVEQVGALVSPRGRSLTLLSATSFLDYTVGARTSLFWARDGQLPEIAGSISNEDTENDWIASGSFLYQLARQGVESLLVRRLPASSFTRTEGQTVPLDLHQWLRIDPPSDRPRDRVDDLAIDPDSGDIVVMESRSATDASSHPMLLQWFSLGPNGYESRFTRMLDKYVSYLGAANRTAVVVADNEISIVSASGDVVAERDLTATVNDVNGILRLDAKRLYLSASFNKDSSFETTSGVLVLRTSDLSEVARYATPAAVQSVAEVGNKLVFGMHTSLAVASPACGVIGTDAAAHGDR